MSNKLYILCGIPFSGKSTLAKKMVEKLGFTRIDLDEIKFSIFGPKVIDSQIDQAGWDLIYKEMYRKIKQRLTNGETVVHDTGNFTKSERQLVKSIATDLEVESITIFVDVPKDEAYKRLLENRQTKKRFDVADIDFESTVVEMEKPDITEKHLTFNYLNDLDSWIDSNIC